MIKTAIKSLAAGALYYSGLLNLLRPQDSDSSGATILMYHRVLPQDGGAVVGRDWERYRSLPGIVVTPEMFEAQLQYLAKYYSVISLSQLLDHFESGSPVPERATVITFDDGWRDNYVYAFPILKKYSMPATIFLTAGYIDTMSIFWPERVIGALSQSRASGEARADAPTGSDSAAITQLVGAVIDSSGPERIARLDRLINAMKELSPSVRDSWLKRIEEAVDANAVSANRVRVMLNWEEIAEMQASGVSFGSHGISHELLTNISLQLAQKELVDSKKLLEAKLSHPVDTLAYPNGNFNNEVLQLAREAGYRCAVSVAKEHATFKSNRFALGRINVHDGCSRGLSGGFSPALFACHLRKFPN